MAIETIVFNDRSFQRRFTIMGKIAGVPNWLSLIVAVAALAYLARDTSTVKNLRGKIGI